MEPDPWPSRFIIDGQLIEHEPIVKRRPEVMGPPLRVPCTLCDRLALNEEIVGGTMNPDARPIFPVCYACTQRYERSGRRSWFAAVAMQDRHLYAVATKLIHQIETECLPDAVDREARWRARNPPGGRWANERRIFPRPNRYRRRA